MFPSFPFGFESGMWDLIVLISDQCRSFFPRGVLDEISDLTESVAEGFPTYSFLYTVERHFKVWILIDFASSTRAAENGTM